MKNRDPFSSAGFFVSSLVHEPLTTLRSTWRGICAGPSKMDSPYKYTSPVLGLSGATLLFLGAASLDPVAIAAGAFPIADVAGRYLEVGNHLPPPKTDTGPPAPTPVG